MKKIAADKNYDLYKKAEPKYLKYEDKQELKSAHEFCSRLIKDKPWFEALPHDRQLDISAIWGILNRLKDKYGQ